MDSFLCPWGKKALTFSLKFNPLNTDTFNAFLAFLAQSLSSFSLGTAVILRRNEKQRLSNFLGGGVAGGWAGREGTRCIMGDAQVANRFAPSLALKQNDKATSMMAYC